MSFQDDFMNGYKKHNKNFDKWCEKAAPVLGNITQCGIVETDSTGHALIAINRPDFGESYIDQQSYLLDEHLTYSDNLKEGFTSQCTNRGVQFLHENEESIYGKKFDLWHGFVYSEQIDANTQRQYYFGSDTPEIYDRLFNNVELVKKFIKYFKQQNEHIVNYFRERKFNIAENKNTYFVNNNKSQSARDKLVSLLHTIDVLDKGQNITIREWQCLQLYTQGRSASQTGQMLGISRRTVETHFERLKKKLKVTSKNKIINITS